MIRSHKTTKETRHEVVMTHDELKSLVANHLQNDILTHAPMLPALKLFFMKDAAGDIMVKGNWREALD
ncbi:MAG: hypothetical protein IH932_01310 [Thaumarchaeota archaeon]|nr:hypothetical protein [Nitrososphaerota archaeon]